MLADKASLSVGEDDELARLVHPPVAEAELQECAAWLGHDGAVPEIAAVVDQRRCGFGVEAEDECSGVDGVDDFLVVWIGRERPVVLSHHCVSDCMQPIVLGKFGDLPWPKRPGLRL